MKRAKCKRGTSFIQKVPLLSGEAYSLIKRGKGKGAKALLNKMLVTKRCTTKTGEVIVKSVAIRKGRAPGQPQVGSARGKSRRSRGPRGNNRPTSPMPDVRSYAPPPPPMMPERWSSMRSMPGRAVNGLYED